MLGRHSVCANYSATAIKKHNLPFVRWFTKIYLKSPPVDGAANKMCAKLLAKKIGISLSKIIITKGQKGRKQILRIKEITELKF